MQTFGAVKVGPTSFFRQAPWRTVLCMTISPSTELVTKCTPCRRRDSACIVQAHEEQGERAAVPRGCSRGAFAHDVVPCMQRRRTVACISAVMRHTVPMSRCDFAPPFAPAFVQAYKNKGEKYKVIWPEEPEFVRVAARFGATIIPVGAVGCEDRCAALPPGPCYHPISAALPGHARQHGGWDQVHMSVSACSHLYVLAACGRICWINAFSALRLKR
jgi:hypothetical protein